MWNHGTGIIYTHGSGDRPLSSSCSNTNNNHVYSVPFTCKSRSSFVCGFLSSSRRHLPLLTGPLLSHILFSFHDDPRDLVIYLYCVSFSSPFYKCQSKQIKQQQWLQKMQRISTLTLKKEAYWLLAELLYSSCGTPPPPPMGLNVHRSRSFSDVSSFSRVSVLSFYPIRVRALRVEEL